MGRFSTQAYLRVVNEDSMLPQAQTAHPDALSTLHTCNGRAVCPGVQCFLFRQVALPYFTLAVLPSLALTHAV